METFKDYKSKLKDKNHDTTKRLACQSLTKRLNNIFKNCVVDGVKRF